MENKFIYIVLGHRAESSWVEGTYDTEEDAKQLKDMLDGERVIDFTDGPWTVMPESVYLDWPLDDNGNPEDLDDFHGYDIADYDHQEGILTIYAGDYHPCTITKMPLNVYTHPSHL